MPLPTSTTPYHLIFASPNLPPTPLQQPPLILSLTVTNLTALPTDHHHHKSCCVIHNRWFTPTFVGWSLFGWWISWKLKVMKKRGGCYIVGWRMAWQCVSEERVFYFFFLIFFNIFVILFYFSVFFYYFTYKNKSQYAQQYSWVSDLTV